MMSTLSESFFLPNIFAGGYNMTSGTASLVINDEDKSSPIKIVVNEDEDKSPPIKIVVNRDNDEAINPHVLSRFAGASSSDFGSRASSRASSKPSNSFGGSFGGSLGGGFGGRFSGDSFGGCAKLHNQINLSPKVINKIVVQKSTAKTVVLIPLLRLMNHGGSTSSFLFLDSACQRRYVFTDSAGYYESVAYMVSVFKPAAVNG